MLLSYSQTFEKIYIEGVFLTKKLKIQKAVRYFINFRIFFNIQGLEEQRQHCSLRFSATSTLLNLKSLLAYILPY